MVNVKQFLETDVLDKYLLGSLDEKGVENLMKLTKAHPEIDLALQRKLLEVELIRRNTSIPPPAPIKTTVDNNLKDLLKNSGNEQRPENNGPLEIRGSSFMDVERYWKSGVIAILIVIVLLIGFIVFKYLENQQLKVLLD